MNIFVENCNDLGVSYELHGFYELTNYTYSFIQD